MGSAKFSISDGTNPVSPFSDAGFTVDIAGGLFALTLQLEDYDTEVRSVEYSVIWADKVTRLGDMPSLSPSSPSPPSAAATLTFVGSELQSVWVQAKVNGGKDANGTNVPKFTAHRIIVVPSQIYGLRLPLMGERQEFDPTDGWAEKDRALIAAVEGWRQATFHNGAPATLAAGEKFERIVNVSGGTFTVPLASTWVGKILIIKNEGTSATNTIARSGSDLIDGATTYALTNAKACVWLYAAEAGVIDVIAAKT